MIDDFDIKILRELHGEGRLPWVELGERVHLSASACQRRAQHLEEIGVLKRISATIDYTILGYSVEAFVAIHVDRKNLKLAEQFRNAISRYPEVLSCHLVSGQIDYMLHVVAADLPSYGQFIQEKILSLPAVKDASSSIVLEPVKDSGFTV